LPRTFDVADIRAFAALLSALFPPPRYAIRDWLAESLEDFFISRYGGTRVEFAESAMSRLPDPFVPPELSAAAVALGDYQRWEPTGVEMSRMPLGLRFLLEGDVALRDPSGRYAVLKKAAFESELRARGLDPAKETDRQVCFSELKGKGCSIYPNDPGLPEPCIFSTASESQAKELSLRRAEENRVWVFVVPTGDEELERALYRRHPYAETYFWYEERYYFKASTRPGDKLIKSWFMSHRRECLRAFGTGRLMPA